MNKTTSCRLPMIKLCEMFYSIDGEGIRAGYPAIFIRTHGCNLHCSYCDSQYACTCNNYEFKTGNAIIEEIRERWPACKRITVTGGEPLLQPEVYPFIDRLLELQYEVNIETNGSIDLQELYKCIERPTHNLIITMDWKSKSSGMDNWMFEPNLNYLTKQDVLKFVVGNEDDLNQMYELLQTYQLDCNIYVSPVWGKINFPDIVQYLLDHDLTNVRMQLQMHKVIWHPDMRGV